MKLGYVLIYVDDVEKTVEFYERAFAQKRRFVLDGYAEMDTGATALGFVGHKVVATSGVPFTPTAGDHLAPGAEVAFVVEDVLAAYDKAVEEGAIAVLPPQKKPWGQTVSYVRDCNGFLVEICSPMAEST